MRGISNDSQMARMVPWIALGLRRAIDKAISRARSRSCSRETTSVTSPTRSAVSAVTRSSLPMSAQRSTSPSGTPRCNIPIGSSALTMPTFACGSKKTASSEQMMMSDSLRKYWAPPAHMPCTAVTTGFQTRCWTLGARSTPGSKLFQTLSFMNQSLPPFRSSPVENARSPFAWSTAQWTSSVSRTVSQAHVMSSAIAWLNEFRLSGRFSVIVATLSATSNRMASRSMLPPGPLVVAAGPNSTLSLPGCGRACGPDSITRPRSGRDTDREEPAVEIKGKKAVIVGGASGMAKATAELLRQKGADIAILDLPQSAGAEVAKELDGSFHEVDVLDDDQVETAMAAAVAALGGLHIAVNTAGGGIGKRTLSKDGPHPIADFRRTIELNLIGTFNLNRLQAFHMSTNEPEDGERGVIIDTASIAAYEGQIGQVAYTAAKAGIAGMTLTMARDLGSLGIRVLAIAPSLFSTGLTEGIPDEFAAALTKDAAFPKRMGRPEEYGRLAVAIVENPMLNGSCIRLDAGQRFAPK